MGELYGMCIIPQQNFKKKKTWGEVPGGPVVRTWCFHCWGPGPIPRRGTKIPQATQCSQKKKDIEMWGDPSQGLTSTDPR